MFELGLGLGLGLGPLHRPRLRGGPLDDVGEALRLRGRRGARLG